MQQAVPACELLTRARVHAWCRGNCAPQASNRIRHNALSLTLLLPEHSVLLLEGNTQVLSAALNSRLRQLDPANSRRGGGLELAGASLAQAWG